MPDASPSRIGPYIVEREIGRGGMGVVHLARDERLDRRVAIKALPDDFAADDARLQRFRREARSLAQLNHPNVAGIHDLEEHDGHTYLILEYVDGETLGDRLRRDPPDVAECIEIARQIAAGVEAAHEAGVIHRDLKPDNIRVTPDGVVKVLDFGLAKIQDPRTDDTDVAESPTVTTPLLTSPTSPGAILGTAPYMSPEQVRGRAVDKRTDIWSYGVILYEMLTGVGLFHGETATDAISAVLRDRIDLDRLPGDTPAHVRRLIERCLQRDPKQRLRDIGDARIELAEAPEAREASHEDDGGPTVNLVRAIAAAALIVVLTLIGARLFLTPESTPTPGPVRLSIDLPDGERISGSLTMNEVAVSPDGTHIALVAWRSSADTRLYVRSLSDFTLRAVEGATDPRGPRFSPDGRWLAFMDGFERIVRTPVEGGRLETLCELMDIVIEEFIWLEEDRLIFTGRSGERLYELRPPDRTLHVIAEHDPAEGVYGFGNPTMTSRTDGVLLQSWSGPRRSANAVGWLDFESGEFTTLITNAAEPQLIAPDRLAFLRDHTIHVVDFDLAQLRVTGEPDVLVESVYASDWSSAAIYDAAASGVMVHLPGSRQGLGRRIVLAHPDGTITPVIEEDQAYINGPVISDDGRRIVYTVIEDGLELWVHDRTTRATLRHRLDVELYEPLFTPGGTAIVAMVVKDGRRSLGRMDLDSGEIETLIPEVFMFPSDWTPDGRLLATMRDGVEGPWKMHVVDLKTGESTPLWDIQQMEWRPRLSPDGRWLVYGSFRSNREEIYVRRFPDGDRDWLVAAGRVGEPSWSADGRAILYYTDVDAPSIMACAFSEDDGRPLIGEAETFITSPSLTVETDYDVSSDGSILMLEAAAWETNPPRPRVTINADTPRR